MWRLSQQDDRGIATVFVVAMMPVLMLFVSLVLDGGRGMVARGETQNAADASALAKATDCAKGITTTDIAPYQTSGVVLANAPTCGSGSTTVSMTRTITATFPLGVGPWDVTKSATARWSILNTSTGVFPITIATCALTGVSFGQKVTFHAHNFGGCTNPSGQFGWTDINCSSPSTVTVGTGSGIGGQTGNTPTACSNTQLDAFIGKDVLVPVWDPNVTSCGKTYCLTTFVQFHLTGWSANGQNFGTSPPSTLQKQCDGRADGDPNFQASPPENTACIRGYFVKFTTETGLFGPGACNTATLLFVCRVYLSLS